MNKSILIPRETIEKRVKELGEQISRDYAESELIIVGVLKGAFISWPI